MNDLLLEFLDNILDEDIEFDKKKLQYQDSQGQSRTVTVKTVRKAGKDHPAWSQYQALLGGKKLPTVDPRKSDTSTKSTTPVDTKRRRGTVPVLGTPDTEFPSVVKDKTLVKVNSVASAEFKRDAIPSDSQFSKTNAPFQIGPPPPAYKFPSQLLNSLKVAPRHAKVLSRLMNTRVGPDTVKLSHFTNAGGAGQIAAQAGELMSLIGSTLSDKDAEIFFGSLLAHEKAQVAANPQLKSPSKRIITKDWILAAANNRRAIMQRLHKDYPNFKIAAGAWDTEQEVTALGLRDYDKNKGFSTDIYLKLVTSDGDTVLDEISLKKSTAVNFLNSGTTKFLEWDKNLPDNINPTVYSKNQRKSLFEFGSRNQAKLIALSKKNPVLQAAMRSKKVTLEQALEKLSKGKGSRGINKVILTAIKELAKTGDSGAIKYLKVVDATHRLYQKDAIEAIASNKNLKTGMLSSIREEFPLKAVGDGEESMAIGNLSLDKNIMSEIFNTSDFNKIKDGLFAVVDENPPYLAYKASNGGRVIPIATIVVREDGVGYGGQIKFEMQLDRRFATLLKAANKKVYGN